MNAISTSNPTTAPNYSTDLVDVMGKQYAVGQTVVRPIPLNAGGSCGLEIRKVAKIASGKLYLDGSSTPVKFPNRLAIMC